MTGQSITELHKSNDSYAGRNIMQQQLSLVAQTKAFARKEWREWWLAGLLYLVALLGQYFYGTRFSLDLGDRIYLYAMLCMFWGLLVPAAVGIWVAHGERSQRTLAFSTALPVSLRNVAWSRLCGSAIVVVAPQLVGAALISIPILAGWGTLPASDWNTRCAAVAQMHKALLLFWIQQMSVVTLVSLLGSRTTSEMRTAAVAVLVVTCEMLLLVLASNFRTFGLPEWPPQFGALSPVTLVRVFNSILHHKSRGNLNIASGILVPVAIHILIVLILAARFVRCYGKVSAIPSEGYRLEQYGSSLIPSWQRFRSPWISLVWLDLRQSLRLTIVGVLIALTMSLLISCIIFISGNRAPLNWRVASLSVDWIYGVGLFWPLIVGASSFAADLRNPLGIFWRSRPISVAKWFWLKYLVGLITMIFFLDLLPALLVYGYSLYAPELIILRENTLRANLRCLPVIHAQCYTYAVLAVVWTRRPILSAGLAFLVITLSEAVMLNSEVLNRFSPVFVYTHLANSPRPWAQLGSTVFDAYLRAYGIAIVVILAAATAAMFAARSTTAVPVLSWLQGILSPPRQSPAPKAVAR